MPFPLVTAPPQSLERNVSEITRVGLGLALKTLSQGTITKEDFSTKVFADGKEVKTRELFDAYSAHKDLISGFKKSLAKAVKETGNTRPLVFIIDELDRCRPTYSIQLLERIKHLAAAEYMTDADVEDDEDEVIRQMLKRGKQPNISFYAFTATPKYKTKHVFDEPGIDGKSPFHEYTMRQAIEERFILDVLASYTTYETYFHLTQSTKDDPHVERKKTARALARFLTLHPFNLQQKTEVMVEHFREHVRHKIGGKAKAMVVTDSRLAAVRYKLEFDAYIANKGYTDVKSLVAFSGTVVDPDFKDKSYTEVSMNNGIKESELPEKFGSEEFQVLLVAEKYQTGFDQPLLHTMYVDKKLSGIQAVQTLSRLNRMCVGKEDTFVLDFRNKTEEIFKAFKPYSGQSSRKLINYSLIRFMRKL